MCLMLTMGPDVTRVSRPRLDQEVDHHAQTCLVLLAGMLVGSGAVAALASFRAPTVTVRQARLTEGTPQRLRASS